MTKLGTIENQTEYMTQLLTLLQNNQKFSKKSRKTLVKNKTI